MGESYLPRGSGGEAKGVSKRDSEEGGLIGLNTAVPLPAWVIVVLAIAVCFGLSYALIPGQELRHANWSEVR